MGGNVVLPAPCTLVAVEAGNRVGRGGAARVLVLPVAGRQRRLLRRHHVAQPIHLGEAHVRLLPTIGRGAIRQLAALVRGEDDVDATVEWIV